MRRWSLILVFIVLGLREEAAYGDVKASKVNAYTVVSPRQGVAVSKTNGYVVLTPKSGVLTSKANAYVVLTPKNGIIVSKTIAYVVLAPPATQRQPSIFIMTKNRIPFLQRTDEGIDEPEESLLARLLPKPLRMNFAYQTSKL